MLLPIYLAWTADKPLSEELVALRLRSIREFLHLDSEEDFVVRVRTDGYCGLAFLEYRNPPLTIPLHHASAGGLAVSAYWPFGVTPLTNQQALADGSWLPELLPRLGKRPALLRELAPPQVFCSLDCQRHRLTLCNDWRGFGRMYEYRSTFGSIWSNKMAAALLFAGVPAELDMAALADMAACGMFTGDGTGYANLRLCGAGTFLEVDCLSGAVLSRRQDSAPCGLKRARRVPDAVERARAALETWTRELALFGTGEINLQLSGGRDSRVVAAALFATGVDCVATLCSPPAGDMMLARQLLQRANTGVTVRELHRREDIRQWYAGQKDLPAIADALLRQGNSDISVPSAFARCKDIVHTPPQSISLCGAQGECTHACFYTRQHVEAERAWGKSRVGLSPAARRIRDVVDSCSVKSLGVTPECGSLVREHFQQNILAKAEETGFTGFQALDFMYFTQYLTRQWAGAVGAFDAKTPLTVFPYAHNGINQSIAAKLQSRFVREVVESFLPVWRDVPFFHELPAEEQQDFHVAYPTFWDMGRGHELVDICQSEGLVWELFDRELLLATSRSLLDAQERASLPSRQTSNINRVAGRVLWCLVIENNLREINAISRRIGDDSCCA